MKKCPECGFENSDEMNLCGECGCILSDNNGIQDDDVKIFVSPDDENEKTVEVKTDSYDLRNDGAFGFGSYDDDDESTVELSKPKKDKKTKEKVAKKDKKDKKGKTLVDKEEKLSYDDYDDTKPDKPRRSGSVSGDIAFIFITLVLILLILALSAVYVDRNFPGETFKEKLAYIFTSSFTDDMITRKPTIEASETLDGEPAIIITVYARKGCVVTFREGATIMERTVEGQSIAFRVPTSLWTSSIKDGDLGSVKIVPNVFVYDPSRSNEKVQLEFEPYNAALQAVDINILTPSTDNITTSSTSVSIEGCVSDNGVAVFMNGNQLQLDENGYFRTVYHVTEEGEQKVVFTAQKSGYSIGSKAIVINYSKSNMQLDIDNDSLRTFDDRIEITGKVKSGVSLSVSGVELDGEVKMSKSGKFEFTALLPSVGNYTITLTANDGKNESSMDIYAEHAPDMDEYMRTTNNFDYDWLINHPTMDKHFGITGTVTEIYQTEPYVRAKLHTSGGDVIFTYYYTTQVATDDNKTYRIYAYPDGTDSETGLPQVYCWFIYKS